MAKDEKSQSRQKPNIFQRIVERIKRFWFETIGELRKVNWPTRREAWNLTIVVLIVVGFMSALLGFLDWVYNQIFALIFSSFG